MKLDSEYWSNRYANETTGWDIGYPSTPIVNYIDQIDQKDIKILIPGCGRAYEATYLFNQGFKNVYILDFSEAPLLDFKQANPEFPEDHLLNLNFFDLQMKFDLVIEQTFFCSLPLQLRYTYPKKLKEILFEQGKAIGLLFDREFEHSGPPFGGNLNLYKDMFEPHFHIKILSPCYNSIEPRKNKELFFIFENRL